MNYCRICGSEKNTRYYSTKRNILCPDCSRETPQKVTREMFDRIYWKDATTSDVPNSIRREFYSDYLSSADNVNQYIEHTITEAN